MLHPKRIENVLNSTVIDSALVSVVTCYESVDCIRDTSDNFDWKPQYETGFDTIGIGFIDCLGHIYCFAEHDCLN